MEQIRESTKNFFRLPQITPYRPRQKPQYYYKRPTHPIYRTEYYYKRPVPIPDEHIEYFGLPVRSATPTYHDASVDKVAEKEEESKEKPEVEPEATMNPSEFLRLLRALSVANSLEEEEKEQQVNN